MVSREELIEMAKKKLKKALAKKDKLLIHTVSTTAELDSTINTLYEKLREWYGIYFPEFKIKDVDKFCRFVILADRGNMDDQAVRRLLGKKFDEIRERGRKSSGADLDEDDLSAIRNLAKEILSLIRLRDSIERYQDELVQSIAPNLCHLIGSKITAKLIAQAGGLEKLANFPASTVQVLGAEKALFKHIRKGTKPPKHGIIFQHPMLTSARPKKRGKIARALATKLAIAAKADAYSKNFIAAGLKKELEKRLKEINKTNPTV